MMLYNIENPCTATLLSITSFQTVMLFDVIKSVDHVVFEPFFEIFANVSIITNLSQITIFGSDRLYFRKMMLMMLDDVMTDHVIFGHKKRRRSISPRRFVYQLFSFGFGLFDCFIDDRGGRTVRGIREALGDQITDDTRTGHDDGRDLGRSRFGITERDDQHADKIGDSEPELPARELALPIHDDSSFRSVCENTRDRRSDDSRP